MDNARIYATIPLDLKRQVDEKLEGGKVKLSELVYIALYQYLNPTLINDAPVLTHKDLEDLKKLLNNAPIRSISYPANELKPLVNPLSTSGIKPGPGAPQRLASIGIKSIDVLRAKRAKIQGLEYNKDFEQYFDLV